MKRSFCKYQAAGNDFIIIDDRALVFPEKNTALIAHLCHRRLGIGSDGLILLRHSAVADFQMCYFNCDGKKAAMCGNGLRCLLHFLTHCGIHNLSSRIQVGDQIYECCDGVVKLGKPSILYWDKIEEKSVYAVDTGVAHAVVFVADLEAMDFEREARHLRFHPLLGEQGANVNYVVLQTDGTLRIRTYERGVEAETLSCGTAAAAVAFVASTLYALQSPLSIIPRSEEPLQVHIDQHQQLFLSGPVTFVFSGEFEYTEPGS